MTLLLLSADMSAGYKVIFEVSVRLRDVFVPFSVRPHGRFVLHVPYLLTCVQFSPQHRDNFRQH